MHATYLKFKALKRLANRLFYPEGTRIHGIGVDLTHHDEGYLLFLSLLHAILPSR